MNKKMRDLQTEILKKTNAAQALMEEEVKDVAKATSLLDEADELKREFDTLARIENAEKASVPNELAKNTDSSGFTLISKMLSGKHLDQTEKAALITGTDAANGENLLIPEDVRLEINELRQSYISAKDIVTIVPTFGLTGSENYEANAPAGLIAFDDGEDIPDAALPKFVKKNFAIKWYGSLIPISNILIGAEKAGLMSYLNNWFIKNAIITENSAIFDALKNGYNAGTPKAVADWQTLKSSINKDLDPSCLINGMIITNQSGFDCLDSATDANGRPILQPNPASATELLFQGLPIKVFPDTQLANIDATHFPIFYGDTKAGCKFIEYQSLQFAYSEHYGFGKNQNYMRVIEGFDIMNADTSAYIYGSLEFKSVVVE